LIFGVADAIAAAASVCDVRDVVNSLEVFGMTEKRKITNETSTWIGERNFLRSRETILSIALIALIEISSIATTSPP
jgi:hypothetical protein